MLVELMNVRVLYEGWVVSAALYGDETWNMTVADLGDGPSVAGKLAYAYIFFIPKSLKDLSQTLNFSMQ